MTEKKDDRPHVDAVCGQAAWMMVNGLALRLVKDGIIPKKTMQADLATMIAHCRKGPNLNPAQRGAGYVLNQMYHMLDTADRSDAN